VFSQHAFTAMILAIVLAVGCSADAAARATHPVQPVQGTGTTVHPALQQCQGPSHRCGIPVKPKCQTITVNVCTPGSRPGDSPRCHPAQQKVCI
jgi:hypothetical protein